MMMDTPNLLKIVNKNFLIWKQSLSIQFELVFRRILKK